MEKIILKAGGTYSICSCGKSKTLPYCDNTHREINEKEKTCYKSVKIYPDKDGELNVSCSNWE